jgi:DNA invertase Pin-like site-specific DNA recombinase
VSQNFICVSRNPSRLQNPDLYLSWGFWDNGCVRVGYARVSRQDQKLEPQRDALLAGGCERVFEEKVSSREVDRKTLRGTFDYCREGDVLVVARLDRLGRSLRELIDLVGDLEGRGVGFRSL